MATIIDELVTILGFETDSKSKKTGKDFVETISGINIKSKLAAVSFAGLTFAIAKFTNNTVKSVVATERFGKLLGVSTQRIQALQGASILAQGTAQDLNGILNILGTGGFFKDPIKGAIELSDRFKEMNAQQALLFGKKFGFGPSQILFLRRGSEEIRKLTELVKKSGTVVSAAQAFEFQEAGKATSELSLALKGLKTQVAAELTPEFTALTKAIALVVGFVTRNVSTVATIFNAFTPSGLVKKALKGINPSETKAIVSVAAGTSKLLKNIEDRVKLNFSERKEAVPTPASVKTLNTFLEKHFVSGDTKVSSVVNNVRNFEAKPLRSSVPASIVNSSQLVNNTTTLNQNITGTRDPVAAGAQAARRIEGMNKLKNKLAPGFNAAVAQ